MVIPTEDSVITEMTSTLRDWGTLWKQLYVVGGSPRPGDGFQRRLSKGSLGWHRAPAVSPPGVGGQGGGRHLPGVPRSKVAVADPEGSVLGLGKGSAGLLGGEEDVLGRI